MLVLNDHNGDDIHYLRNLVIRHVFLVVSLVELCLYTKHYCRILLNTLC